MNKPTPAPRIAPQAQVTNSVRGMIFGALVATVGSVACKTEWVEVSLANRERTATGDGVDFHVTIDHPDNQGPLTIHATRVIQRRNGTFTPIPQAPTPLTADALCSTVGTYCQRGREGVITKICFQPFGPDTFVVRNKDAEVLANYSICNNPNAPAWVHCETVSRPDNTYICAQ